MSAGRCAIRILVLSSWLCVLGLPSLAAMPQSSSDGPMRGATNQPTPAVLPRKETGVGDIQEQVVVEEGTAVRLKAITGWSSKSSRPGDRVELAVEETVWADGLPIIPRGTPLMGHIIAATPAATRLRMGFANLAINEVKLESGGTLSLRLQDRSRRPPTGKDTLEALAYASPLTFLPNVGKGSEDVIREGETIWAFLGESLVSSRRILASPQFPSDSPAAHVYYVDYHTGLHRRLYIGRLLVAIPEVDRVVRFSTEPSELWFSTGRSDATVHVTAQVGHDYLVVRDEDGLKLSDFRSHAQTLLTGSPIRYVNCVNLVPDQHEKFYSRPSNDYEIVTSQ